MKSGDYMKKDEDELQEFYKLQFKSINGVSEHSSFVENSFETSFEGEGLQAVLDNIFDFLKKAGYTYIGGMEVTSKDGQKKWVTNGIKT